MTRFQAGMVEALRLAGWVVDLPSRWRRSPVARHYDEMADVTVAINEAVLTVDGAWGRPREVMERISYVCTAADRVWEAERLAKGTLAPADE